MAKPRIKIDAYKLHKLRADLSRQLGKDVTKACVARQVGITRTLIVYMEDPTSTRGFRFETVYLLARYYREALKDPKITTDFLALEMDRMHTKPRISETQADYQVRTDLIQELHNKINDLSQEELTRFSGFLSFLLSQQRHKDDS